MALHFLNTGFDSSDFLVSLGLADFDHLDEVVRFRDSTVGLDSNNVHVHKMLVGESFASEDVSHIDDALVAFIRVIVKEDVLGGIV